MFEAINKANANGFTPAQQRALLNNPGLSDAYMGSNIDKIFKNLVSQEPGLSHLQITPPFKFGPDVFNPATQEWWDLTTPGQWGKHVTKYSPFGNGTPLFWK